MKTREMLLRLRQPGGGVTFLGVAAILYGVACLLHGDFAVLWQPVPKGLPLREPLAYLSASLLILGGAGLLTKHGIRTAAIVLLVLFMLYDACYLLKLIGPPADPRALLGLAEQSSVAIGCWAILLGMQAGGPVRMTTARIAFGICSLLFALAHFAGLKQTAQMVPEWMPGGQVFWAIATGVGHLAVGLALIANRIAVPATRLGGLMYISFALFSWLPGAVMHPTERLRWAGFAISLCMAAALWLVGDLLASPEEGDALNGRRNATMLETV